MNPIRVLYLIDSMTHGGTEKQLAELIRGVDRTRVRPHLVTLKPSSGLYEELDVPKCCLGFSSFGSVSLVGVLRRLAGFIAEHEIAVVQTFFQDPFLLAALVKPFRPVKLIGSFRDLGFWRNEAESRKMRLACRFFDGFIANSEAVKEHFAKKDGLDPERIAVIYNGFDLAAVPAGPAATEEEIVGIVANLNRPVKRVQDFIEAAALVHQKRPQTSFVVVGGGHLQPELQALAAQRGIGACTSFTGMIPDPLEQSARFSVGVITSETEGFCNAIIEYMACGVPVVATRVGGNPELVEEGENGYLYDCGDAKALAEKILTLLESETERRRMAETNRTKIRTRFSAPSMLARTEEYYLRMVGRA